MKRKRNPPISVSLSVCLRGVGCCFRRNGGGGDGITRERFLAAEWGERGAHPSFSLSLSRLSPPVPYGNRSSMPPDATFCAHTALFYLLLLANRKIHSPQAKHISRTCSVLILRSAPQRIAFAAAAWLIYAWRAEEAPLAPPRRHISRGAICAAASAAAAAAAPR